MATIRKQAPTAGGIAVRARDTGRILMLQRSIADPDDPNRGTWEFPGGNLEHDEQPFDGARREWEEETGVPLPAGEHAGIWRHGVYEGHIWVVPHETDLHLNADRENRPVGNPDDPDGDDIETVAWLSPGEAQAMPKLRNEVRAGTDWQAIERAAPGAVAKRDTRPVVTLRRRISIRKRSFPTLVRAHVRGGRTLPSDAQAELRRFLNAHPDMRAQEAAEHGFDPLADLPRYVAAERGEGEHPSLNVTPLTADAIRQWEREETEQAQGVVKEQPAAGDVHVDSASNILAPRKRKRSDEPEEAQEMGEDPQDPDRVDVRVLKTDDEQRIVWGIVLEPDVEDAQHDIVSKEDVELAAHRFLYNQTPMGVQHRRLAPEGTRPVESYIAPVDFEMGGQVVKAGSWVLATHVPDDELWGEVKKGLRAAYSVAGSGKRTPV